MPNPVADRSNIPAEVLRETGERRLQAWVKNRILEPRFDDPRAQMPSPNVSEAETRVIAAYLLYEPSWAEQIKGVLLRAVQVRPTRRDVAVLLLGLGTGVRLSLLVWFVHRIRNTKCPTSTGLAGRGEPVSS